MDRKVFGIGETVLDIIFKNDTPLAANPGGSVFNSMISLGRSGVPATFVSQTGEDHVGDIVVNFLRDNGVCPDYVYRQK
ncbi:MAG: carbohydrate kinase, partial [Bacteroidaceae bacterium]|nr:carbohydrate kinase [Bacteroidaceae bacterium]